MKNHTAQAVYSTIGAVTFGLAMNATTVQAQIIATPTGDPGATGTIITPINTQIDITGGTQAGSALFHSFTQLDISKGQTANFQTPADVQNVLTRVTNGVPSTIDGTLQLSGAKANLYFMNPAGIVFGPNANLNLPASFVGTTASSIEIHGQKDSMTFEDRKSYTFKTFERDLNANPIDLPNYISHFNLNFPDKVSGSIINFGNLSLSSGNDAALVLIGQNVWSPADIKTQGNVILNTIDGHTSLQLFQWDTQVGLSPASDLSNSSTLTVPRFDELVDRANLAFGTGISSRDIRLNPRDIVVRNIDATGGVYLHSWPGETSIIAQNIRSGNGVEIGVGSSVLSQRMDKHHRIEVGDIQTIGSISLSTSGDITTGHLHALPIRESKPTYGQIEPIYSSTIGLYSLGVISVASLLSEGDSNTRSGINIDTTSTFQATDTIDPLKLGKLGSDITIDKTQLSLKSPISIATDGFIHIKQNSPNFAEGINLERDSNQSVIYRLASNPNTQVEIIATNPQDGSLILKNRSTGEVIIGDRVVINSIGSSMSPSKVGSQGLIARFNQSNTSLTELSGTLKSLSGIDLLNGTFSDYEIMLHRMGIVPISGVTINSPAPSLTPETTPEATPSFDRTSILNATIDPTDAINLSAGAIRGATINPGGLLKIELDTRNPEGVLTRKVTTK
jgi:filamentous hemagglutinin family protein